MWDIIGKMARSVSKSFERDVMVQSGLAIIKEKISSMADNVGKALSQFSRIIDIEKESDDTWDPDKKEYTTEYPKFQVVLANLIGPGRVLDGKHPAIVWESSKKDATVVVIPLTSKKGSKPSLFDLGFIDELILDPAEGPKESIVVMNQIHTIPRKSITILTKMDKITPITLSKDQQNKVMDLYVRQYFKRKHDLQYVLKKVVKQVPPIEAGQTDWINDLKRPVVHAYNDGVLHYMLADETWKSIPVISLPIRYGEQRRIIDDLTSESDDLRARAITKVQSIQTEAHAAPTNPASPGSLLGPGTQLTK